MLGVLSYLITAKNWKVRDLKEFAESHPSVQAFFLASLSLEAEEYKKLKNKRG